MEWRGNEPTTPLLHYSRTPTMKLAILSDIHDNIWNLRAALEAVREADALLCCGDLCSPFIVGLLAGGFAGPIHIVFGNNDGDLFRIERNAVKAGDRVKLHAEFADIALDDGFRVAMNHYPAIAEGLAQAGLYSLVCYGHDHKVRVHQVGPTLVVNPGAVMGYDPVAGADIPATCLLLDTETMHVETVTLGREAPA
jgi:hypothetical protein